MDNRKITQAKANALARFAGTGPDHINCSQTVLAFALHALEDDQHLATIAAYMGGGIAGMGEACGAITGAALALGERDRMLPEIAGLQGDATKEALQKIIRDFAQQFGSCRCRDLTGYDLSTPEGFQAFKASEDQKRCALYVEWAIDQISPLLAGATEGA